MQRECKWCDSTGIMYLYPGEIKAPCLECSPYRKLEDLERELSERVVSQDHFAQRKEIQAHNKRMKAL